MASQDFLFSVMPRNTRVELDSDSGKVTRVQKKTASEAVSDEEGVDATQNARVERRLKDGAKKRKNAAKSKQQQREAAKGAAKPTAEPTDESSDGNHDSGQEPEGKKGLNLDLYV